jgi:hypothetical protein
MGWKNGSLAGLLATMGVSLLLLGCPSAGGGGDAGGGTDTTPPTFGGLASVTPEGLTQMVLTWDAASDNDTAAEEITYEIWQADIDNLTTDTPPTLTTTSGATSAAVTVPGFRQQYFLVQATDSSGNRDGNTTVASATTTQAIWDYLDGGGATDGVDSSASETTHIALEVLSGKLYAAWVDYDSGRVKVSLQNGGNSWTSIDNSELIVDSGATASSADRQRVAIQGFEDRLYVSWTEPENGSDRPEQIQVAVYDPNSPDDGWTFVDGNPTGGLNVSTGDPAGRSSLAVVDGALYAAWYEDGEVQVVYAAKYNGDDSNPSWTTLGSELNYTETDGQDPDAASFDGKLVVVWVENPGGDSSDIRAKSYNPTTEDWTPFDGGSLKQGTRQVQDPMLAASSTDLYLVWRENNTGGVYQLRSLVHNGSFWTIIDGDQDAGLNYDSAQLVDYPPAPFVLDDQFYVAFSQFNDAKDAYQLRAIVFGGDESSPNWQFVDGDSSTGLNVDTDYAAIYPSGVAHDGSLVVGWGEAPGISVNRNVRVIRGK